jgi:hypothetical protein
MLTTGYLNDSLVSKRFEYGGCELSSGSTVSTCALDPRAVGEHVSVSGQVQRVIPPALHKHQVTHVVILLLLLNLLSPRGCSILKSILLFLMRVLVPVSSPTVTTRLVALLVPILGVGRLVPVLKGEHLARLLIVKHVLVVLQLMRHLSEHLRGILMWVLNVMITFSGALVVSFSGSIAESVSCGVSALHPVRSL